MKIWQKIISVIATFALLFNSLVAPLSVLAQTVDETPSPTPIASPEPVAEAVEATPIDSPKPKATAVEAITEATATPEATPIDSPESLTEAVDATPPTSPEPTAEAGQAIETQAPESNPTVQGPPTATPTLTSEVPAETGTLSATILENTTVDTSALDAFDLSYQTDGSAVIVTDKLDYSPYDTAIITGSGFIAGKTYELTVSSEDDPATSTTVNITASETGTIMYAYELDHTYRPNYSVVVKDLERVVATTAFTDANINCLPNPATTSSNVTCTVNGVGNDKPAQIVWFDADNQQRFSDGCNSGSCTSTHTPSSEGVWAVKLIKNGSEKGSGTFVVSASIVKTTPIIIFGSAPNPTYLGGNFTVSATTSNTDSSVLTYSAVSGPCALVSGSTFSSSGAGICVVQASGSVTTNFNSASNTQSVVIGKATPIVTWGNPVDITYGVVLSGTQLNATTTIPGNFVYSPVAGITLGTGAGQVLSTTFTPDDTTNYNTATKTVVINVNKADATCSIIGYSGTYNGNTHGASGSCLGVGGVNLSAGINYGLTFINYPGGTAHWTFTGGTNYLDENGDVGITISKANQTISVTTSAPSTAPYGSSFGVAATSGLTVAITTTGGCSISGNTVTMTSGTSDCVVHYNQEGDSNYNAATEFTESTTAQPRSVTVTADLKSKTYGDSDPALTYSVTGSLVGNDSFNGSLNRVAGEDVGHYAINQGDVTLNSNYSLTYIGADLDINARLIEVTADPQAKTYGDSDPPLTYQITGGSLAFSDVFTGLLTRDPGEDVGPHAIVQGSVALNSNYTLTYLGDNLTIGSRSITVTAIANGKVYGEYDPALTYTSDSLVGFDTFNGTLSRDAGEDVDTYSIIQGSLTAGSNYAINFVPANFIISSRNITITADSLIKIFGESDPALTYQFTDGSLILGDSVSGALTRDLGEAVGAYNITQGTLSLNDNYNLTFVGGTLGITPFDVCKNIDGVQTSIPDGMHMDAGGVNCVNFSQAGPPDTSGSGGTVLGTSTTLPVTTWPKLAYAGTGEAVEATEDVLGTETQASPAPEVVAAQDEAEKVGLIKWILTHKKISLGVIFGIIVIWYLLRKRKKS